MGAADTERFLVNIAGYVQATTTAPRSPRQAMIDPAYDPTTWPDTRPRVVFDGEVTATRKRWPVASGYTPHPGDRVVMLPLGKEGWLVLCRTAPSPPPQTDVLTATGTWAKPTGAAYLWVQVLGGGGAGGGAATTGASQTSAGSGGQGGGYAASWLPAVQVPATVTVTIGPGGTANSGAAGGAGSASSFGGLVSASGGAGGVSLAAAGTAGGNNGGGATAQTLLGDITADGQGGGAGFRGGTSGAIGGQGGSSALAAGGRGLGVITGAVAGTPGRGPGGGGSGGAVGAGQSAQPGGEGAPGTVLVTAFF
ncbi:hypothetical protein ACFVWN_01125 [Nocardiopsis flavescens]|uniref:glycine-rich domain-containing protein n=1 Tax=Nocardiopsis flavescens TaxID=758803 RepID=UPI00364CA7A5